ncbi:MAG: aspartate-semialdehyde dehydrogenase [Candidatus Eisenbacteria bacterium]
MAELPQKSRAVSIVGATGLVGSEIAKLLFLRKFPLGELSLFSSGRTSERRATIAGKEFPIRPFSLGALGEPGFCFLAAGGETSRQHAHAIADLGHVVIDNSSAFRMHPDVPLVVPEVNAGDLRCHRGIIANPNCSTIQMVVVLAPLHRLWELKRVIVSTYQSVSGAGLQATGELATHSSAALEGRTLAPRAFADQIAFNVIPRIDVFDSEGWTGEERKLMNETRKILGDGSIEVVATAARVPVFRCHSESVYAEFGRELDLAVVRQVLACAPGVKVVDDPASGKYPMPVNCVGQESTFVGRLRLGPASAKALSMWIVSDNVWKGAALNAVQIAEELL